MNRLKLAAWSVTIVCALSLLLLAVTIPTVSADTAQTSVDIRAPIKSISIDFSQVYFGSLFPGANKYLFGDTRFSPGDGAPTLNNTGEINVSIQISATDMTAYGLGGEVIGVIPKGSLGIKVVPIKYGNLGMPVVVDGIEVGKLYAMDYDINVPPAVANGKYVGTTDIIAV